MVIDVKKRMKKIAFAIISASIIASNVNIFSASVTSYAHEIKKKAVSEYIISQDGSGDFCTIQEGVNNAKNGDTLIIYPGTYNENVEVMGKSINIKGIDKDTCIIQCDTASYRKSPLTIAAGKVSNLTIYGMYSGAVSNELTDEEIALINSQITGDSWERQKNYSGYAVHIDQNCLYKNEIRFENCKIISENNYCAGIGSRGKCNIAFEGCEFIALGSGGCIYLHDCTSLDLCGTVGFSLKDCLLTNYLSPYVMSVQSLMPTNTTNFTFQNVRVSAVAYEDKTGYDINNMSTSYEANVLSYLDKTGQLSESGFTSTVMHNMVHELTLNESNKYMKHLENCRKNNNTLSILSKPLPEGITYIASNAKPKSSKSSKTASQITSQNAKRQIISVFNADGLTGDGWCGLNNYYLTMESSGNTLIEMNAVDLSNQKVSE